MAAWGALIRKKKSVRTSESPKLYSNIPETSRAVQAPRAAVEAKSVSASAACERKMRNASHASRPMSQSHSRRPGIPRSAAICRKLLCMCWYSQSGNSRVPR